MSVASSYRNVRESHATISLDGELPADAVRVEDELDVRELVRVAGDPGRASGEASEVELQFGRNQLLET